MSAYRPHVMVDLETLSLRKDAAIIQVAALVFEPLTGERGAQFNAFVSGLEGHVRPDTVAWWMQQPAARRVGAGMAGGHCIAHALQSFTLWLQGVAGPELQDLAGLWAHGSSFDHAVLGQAYAVQGIKQPWSYRVERCTRTLYALTPGGMPEIPADPEREHDAAYDCERQVATVVEAVRRIRAAGLEVAL